MAGRALTILLVEDDPDTVLTFRIVLQRMGHTVDVATGVEAALVRLAQEAVDVVLCDLGLPGGRSGLDLARVMQRQPALRRIPIVALTGYGQQRDRDLTAAAGFAAHLTKPVGLAELRSTLTAVSAPAGAGRSKESS